MHQQHHLHGIDVRCLSFTGSEKESIRSLRDSFWFQILPFDLAAAESAGKIMASLAFRGTPIGDRDMLIAGHALLKKFPIVTHNVREFERVTGFQIEDWLDQYPSL